MYICGNCKKEMKLASNGEVICVECNNKHKLGTDNTNDQDINVIMDYKSFKDFLKIIK